MKKNILSSTMLMYVFCVNAGDGDITGYVQVGGAYNAIKLRNKPFDQSQNYTGQLRYHQATGFPSLNFDIGIESGKQFRFFRHENSFVCGLKMMVSSTEKTLNGDFRIKSTAQPQLGFVNNRYHVRHDFNMTSFEPYVGIVLHRGNHHMGLTGGVTCFRTMLETMRIYERVINDEYTGLYLKPENRALGGTLRVFFDTQWDNMIMGLSYGYTRATQRYARQVHLEQASIFATEVFQNLYLYPDANDFRMNVAPEMQIQIHSVSLYVGIEI